MKNTRLSFLNSQENDNWHSIRGWLLPSAAEKLYQYASEASLCGSVVEIGSFAGKSTVCIAKALQQKLNSPNLISIDVNFQPEFDSNIAQFGLAEQIQKIQSTSLVAADNWENPISFIYIDGHHGKAHAYADFVVWETMLQPEGVIAFDNTAGFFQGPSLQVQSAIRTGAYQLLGDAGGVSFLRKKSSLVPAIGNFPVKEGTLAALIIKVSAWLGAMDPNLRLPPLPKWQYENASDAELRAKTIEKVLLDLEQIEAFKGLNWRTTQTIQYLRGCVEIYQNNLDLAINIFTELYKLDTSCSLVHYQIDVRHLAALRLAQVYDIQGSIDLAQSIYQQILNLNVIPEIAFQAKIGLATPFKLATDQQIMLLRNFVLKSPFAKYRDDFQPLQEVNHTEIPKKATQLDQETIKKTLGELQGMTSLRERLYLYNYTKETYLGEGEIVELGAWLGSSSICMAMGLEHNSNVNLKHKRIHVYDLFQWINGWDELPVVAGTTIAGRYQPGDSFIDEYLNRTQPWEDEIQVYQDDLTAIGWNQPKKIEYLFVDAMKSWHLVNSIVNRFFPYLIPGLSLLHQNDWGHIDQPGIHLSMYKLREYFNPVYDAAPAMIFQYIRQIPQSELEKIYDYSSFSDVEIEQAYDYCLDISPAHMHPMLMGAKTLCWIYQEKLDKAQQELNLAKSNYGNNQAFTNRLNLLEKQISTRQILSKI
jgi:predicted O-methyltransferase YrrM